MKNTVEKVVIVEKESYKTAIWVFIIALLVIGLIISNYDKKQTGSNSIEDKAQLISADEYLNIIKEDKLNVILFSSPECPYCIQFEPIIVKVIDDYKLDVYYFNTLVATSSDLKKIESSSSDLEGFGTPTIAITKNNEVIDVNSGYVEESKLLSFFRENNIINN